MEQTTQWISPHFCPVYIPCFIYINDKWHKYNALLMGGRNRKKMVKYLFNGILVTQTKTNEMIRSAVVREKKTAISSKQIMIWIKLAAWLMDWPFLIKLPSSVKEKKTWTTVRVSEFEYFFLFSATFRAFGTVGEMK